MSERDHSAADRRLEQLEHQAAHARRRYELYKAKVYGPRRASPARLRELLRKREFADARLSRAQGAFRSAAKAYLDTREELEENARIEAELKRDPNRGDNKVARASRSPVTAVRAVRERLGLYFTRR